jgi:hypothetical protein
MLFFMSPKSEIRDAETLLCIACFPFNRRWQGQVNSRVCAYNTAWYFKADMPMTASLSRE